MIKGWPPIVISRDWDMIDEKRVPRVGTFPDVGRGFPEWPHPAPSAGGWDKISSNLITNNDIV